MRNTNFQVLNNSCLIEQQENEKEMEGQPKFHILSYNINSEDNNNSEIQPTT